MISVPGKRALVVGLARSGRAAAAFLRRHGANVVVTDSRAPWMFQAEIPELLATQIGLELGTHREGSFLASDLIVVSPGVPWELAPLQAARARGITVIPEVELAGWFLKGRMVGVTGSNGKTTTTTLIAQMLEAAGVPAFVGGNIGVPLIAGVEKVPPPSVVLAELSSFQLEAIQTLHPHIAVLLNVTPNHLDRHHSFEAYIEAKAQIFRNQTADDCAVLNADDPIVMSLVPRIKSRKLYFSGRQNLPEGWLVSHDQILYRTNNLERPLMAVRDLPLRGAFNRENVLAAAAAAGALGVNFEAIARVVREFRGVEHRLEFVSTIEGVEFYNDSKATSVDATVKALSAFESGVHLILGGQDKGAPYTPVRNWIPGRVREVLLIGAAAERIERELLNVVELVRADDLETATRTALEHAQPGDVVLLSPACASYDQFQNFEHRGRVFKEIVARLAQERRSSAVSMSGASGATRSNETPAGDRPKPNWQPDGLEGGKVPPSGAEPAKDESHQPSTQTGVGSGSAFSARPVLDPRELTCTYEVRAAEVEPLPIDVRAAPENQMWLGLQGLGGVYHSGGPAANTGDPLIFEIIGNGEADEQALRRKEDQPNGHKPRAGHTRFV